MKLTVTGDINAFYVQTLCMIFFPGEKFEQNPIITEETPIMHVSVTNSESASFATATLTYMGKTVTAEKSIDFVPERTKQRSAKIAAGNVVLAVGSEILGYRPSWGILTGVRPSKVAMEMLLNGNSKTKVRKILNNDYYVIPKKASLATDIARREQKLIATPDIKDCSIYISIPFSKGSWTNPLRLRKTRRMQAQLYAFRKYPAKDCLHLPQAQIHFPRALRCCLLC